MIVPWMVIAIGSARQNDATICHVRTDDMHIIL